MKKRPVLFSALVALVAVGAASSAPAQTTDFPADAKPFTAETLKGLEGKTFVGKRADGREWTMDFGPDAAYKLTASAMGGGPSGEMLDGKVRMDGEKVCQDMRKAMESSCNDVRTDGKAIFYKRNSNGEVVTLIAK